MPELQKNAWVSPLAFPFRGWNPVVGFPGVRVLRWVFILVLPSKKKSTYDSKTKDHRFPWNIFAKSRWVWWVECWHGTWFAVNGCSFGVFYFRDSHTNKYNRNLKISSELCPLIHDRNHAGSAIKIAKDRGIQAFDGLRINGSRLKNLWVQGKFGYCAHKLFDSLLWDFKDLCGHFVGKKHIAREFCVVFWGGNAKAWVASPQKRAELNADKKALQPIKCYCPNDARLFPVTSGSTVKCCNGFELWGGLKIADSTRPAICGYTFAGPGQPCQGCATSNEVACSSPTFCVGTEPPPGPWDAGSSSPGSSFATKKTSWVGRGGSHPTDSTEPKNGMNPEATSVGPKLPVFFRNLKMPFVFYFGRGGIPDVSLRHIRIIIF